MSATPRSVPAQWADLGHIRKGHTKQAGYVFSGKCAHSVKANPETTSGVENLEQPSSASRATPYSTQRVGGMSQQRQQ